MQKRPMKERLLMWQIVWTVRISFHRDDLDSGKLSVYVRF